MVYVFVVMIQDRIYLNTVTSIGKITEADEGEEDVEEKKQLVSIDKEDKEDEEDEEKKQIVSIDKEGEEDDDDESGSEDSYQPRRLSKVFKGIDPKKI